MSTGRLRKQSRQQQLVKERVVAHRLRNSHEGNNHEDHENPKQALGGLSGKRPDTITTIIVGLTDSVGENLAIELGRTASAMLLAPGTRPTKRTDDGVFRHRRIPALLRLCLGLCDCHMAHVFEEPPQRAKRERDVGTLHIKRASR